MNHYVSDFEKDDDCAIPTSSTLTRSKRSITSEDEIMELLWQNGQVVVQSQTQMSLKKSQHHKYDNTVLPIEQSTPREIRSSHEQQQHLLMQEDEMAPWLHYPLNDTNFDQDFCADLLYPSTACVTSTTTNTSAAPIRSTHNPEARLHPAVSAATATATATNTATASRPPIPPTRRAEVVQNFAYFSRHRARGGVSESGPSNLKTVLKESTVVDSSDTPAMVSESRISEAAFARSTAGVSSGDNACGIMSGAAVAGTSSRGGGSNNKDLITCEMTVTSSPGGSSASAEPPSQKLATDDRKRKGREDETEYHSEDVEFESTDAKRQLRGSTSMKRSRAAEVHNLSERRRRDRINEKMRALQELIPRCNKSDKASMLDEAIEYLKSLQLQIQMMSMGCSMVPMMFPGIQQYMLPLGMGMGMGMGTEMGMNRPMMPFPNVLAGAPMPTPAAAAHLGPRFPNPTFHMPTIPTPAPDPSRIQATNQSDPMLSAISTQNPNLQHRVLNFSDPYQQYLGLQQTQTPVSQNQAKTRPITSKPGTSQAAENLDNHQSGT
ncbi:hypothetical protein P3X46_017872 [Hevea brasiliensis]|uniref:BHLH domain-containing protein n=1 Tax=Hevea brasiliensis TaxID=3981 RepID=A0ABQ9LP04_HEVBR|nr:transcription factor PIF1 isoform X2 [Hevea brasiliensis]KAJ9169712.1 hypothetical protein P3X46_017872 [Hevea brasiliensis]KAJ9169713.1 hypothetical protein P3X46_017872 [Hevea brasiliensis]